MKNSSKLKALSKDQLKQVNGGMRWTSDRGCNVLDLRGGRSRLRAEFDMLWCKATNW